MGSPPETAVTGRIHVAPALPDAAAMPRLQRRFDGLSSVVEVVAPGSPAHTDVTVLHAAGQPDHGVPAAAAIARGGRPVLVVSDHGDERVLLRMLRAGVRGYLVEPVDQPRLLDAVLDVAAGGLVVDADVASRAALLAARLIDLDRPPAELLGLSDREVQVLDRLAGGATAREVGSALFVSHETVRSHLKRIYRKLGVHDRDAALRRAREEGVLTGV